MITFKEKQKTLYKRILKLREKSTYAEQVFKIKLTNLNIKFCFQKAFIKGNNYCIVDFYLPKPYKLCIEIDGLYHNNPEQIKRDINRDKYLKLRKFKILHLSNEIAINIKDEELYDLLQKLLYS